jgi:hypothetical protein
VYRAVVGIVCLGVALPSEAHAAGAFCCGRKMAMTFANASLDVKLVTLALWLITLASVVVWVLALRRVARISSFRAPRTVAFLSAWRAAGPLAGAAAACKVQSEFWVGVYAYPPVEDYMREVMGPGLAEFWMLLWAGFMAGAVATLARSHLLGRIEAARAPSA